MTAPATVPPAVAAPFTPPGTSPNGITLEMDDAPTVAPVKIDDAVLAAVRTIAASETRTKYIYIDKMAPAAIEALTKQLKLARDALGLRGRIQDVINPHNNRRALFVKLYPTKTD